jgi:ACDE family multidrug resistance protein
MPALRAETRLPFAALATVPFVMVLSNSMIVPVLPDIQRALRTGPFRVGLLITAFSVAAGLVIPVGGYLSDRIGRKAVMIPSLFLFGLGGGLAGLAPLIAARPYALMIGGRILQGIGAGGTYQVAMALAGDIFRTGERSKALGLLEAANGLGKVISPILGSAAALLAWYAPFFLYPVVAWASAACVWTLVREPRDTGARDRPFPAYLRGLAEVWRRKALPLAASFFAGALVLFFLFGVLSFYADLLESPHGVRGLRKGLVIAIPVAVMALTSYLSGTYLVKRLARFAKVLVVGGLGVVTASFVAMFLLRQRIYPFSAAIALMGFGNGLVLPALNTLITSATSTRERGTVTSLYGTVRFFGAAFGPPAFTKAVPLGPAGMYLGSAALAALSLAAAAAFVDQRRMLPERMLREEGTREGKGPGQRPEGETRPAVSGPSRSLRELARSLDLAALRRNRRPLK